MTFKEAIKHLGIEKYGERIFDSNSHGELFHLTDYIAIADTLKDQSSCVRFAHWFENIVNEAEETWDRPESVFQHMLTIFQEE